MPQPRRAPPSSTRPSPGSTTTETKAAKVTLVTAAWQLPRGSARAVLLSEGDHLLLAGGLDGGRRTTAQVLRLEPTTGSVTSAGTLVAGVHDAAGAVLHGVPMVFGGGSSTESRSVQALEPGVRARVIGQLPVPRSDLATAMIANRVFLLGGYDGSSIRATALATADGVTFDRLGDLPVPVRYPAVAALGSAVYVIGGSTDTGAVRAVQVLDTVSGTVRLAGQLPQPLTDAVAATLRGRVYVFGGKYGGVPSAQVWRLDVGPSGAASIALTPVATLPTPVTAAAVAVLGDTAYLVGGESPGLLTTVSMLEAR